MIRLSLRALALAWFVLLLAAACNRTATGSLVVGVTSDFRAGVELNRLDVNMSVDGQVISEPSLILGQSAGLTSFPAELAFEEVPIGSRVAITLRGHDGRMERVVRHLETEIAAAERRLVRVHLESRCQLEPDVEGGPPGAPRCDDVETTCIAGMCQPAFVPPAAQEPYTDNWASDVGDACKPRGAGPPQVVVGEGQSDYLAMADYGVAQVEAGPQGGHHIWVAVRTKNLRQSGSITEVGGELPALGLSIVPLRVVFTMERDEGGWCKLYGLRFQLDIDSDVMAMLGHELKVVVSIEDPDGAVGTGERWVTLSDDIL